jgi:hypothetical protein
MPFFKKISLLLLSCADTYKIIYYIQYSKLESNILVIIITTHSSSIADMFKRSVKHTGIQLYKEAIKHKTMQYITFCTVSFQPLMSPISSYREFLE